MLTKGCVMNNEEIRREGLITNYQEVVEDFVLLGGCIPKDDYCTAELEANKIGIDWVN